LSLDTALELNSQRHLEVEVLNQSSRAINWDSAPLLTKKMDLPDLVHMNANLALEELFSESNLRKWFMREQWLALHQTLLSLNNYKELIHLSVLLDYMELWPEENDFFYVHYFKCKDLVADLTPDLRKKVLLRAYQNAAERLRNLALQRRRWGLELSQYINSESNVNQMPSGEPLISTISGYSSQSEASLHYTTKDYPSGQTKFEGGVLATRYNKAELKNRNYETYRLGLDHQILLPGALALGGFSLDVRSDVLNLNNVKELNSTSYIPGINLISQPTRLKKGGVIDTLTHVGVIYFEHRRYHGAQKFDEFSRPKDLQAFHLNYLAVLQKKNSWGNWFSTFSLGYREQSSKAKDLEYGLYNAGFGLQCSTSLQSVAFQSRLSERRQDDYQRLKRNDRTLDLEFTYDRRLGGSAWSLQSQYIYTHQTSNLNLMPFDNHQLRLGITWQY
jgi:hypothetical protein